jgi:hypothetical protein
MFDFLKKKKIASNKLNLIEASFISVIINGLSKQYPQFKQQLELETFVGITHDPLGPVGSFTYTLNDNSWQKICSIGESNFDIKNILFGNCNKERVVVDVYTMEGLIFGYHTTENISNINLDTIDVSNIWEKRFVSDDYTEIASVVNKLPKVDQNKLNMLKNTFKISINQAEYYPVHDIGDGNYYAIDKNGSVFKITHDPFEANKLDNTILELLNK